MLLLPGLRTFPLLKDLLETLPNDLSMISKRYEKETKMKPNLYLINNLKHMDTFTSNVELVNVGQGIDLYNTHEGNHK